MFSFAKRGVMAMTVLCLLFGAQAALAESYKIDPVHSSVIFRIKHLNTSYFWGRFNNVGGTLKLDDPAAAVEVQIKAESVDTNNANRDQHIKSPDFLNAKQFPEITFKSTAVKKVADGKYDVEGNLTMHGATKPLTVQLVKIGSGKGQRGGAITGFEAVFDIKRSEWGMTGMLEGLSDDIRLHFGLECGQ